MNLRKFRKNDITYSERFLREAVKTDDFLLVGQIKDLSQVFHNVKLHLKKPAVLAIKNNLGFLI